MAEVADFTLLRDYVERSSEDAFRALLARHVNLVYSVAFRRLGDDAAAKDVTQVVFATLARKARHLSGNVILSGWLFQVATHACENMRRAEIRRKKRETEAVRQQMTDPQPSSSAGDRSHDIARALATLRASERDAIVLRFFEGKPFGNVALSLGISEAAAKMRVARGIGKLRRALQRSGIAISESALGSALPQFIQQAPSSIVGAVGAAVAQSTYTSSEILLLKGVLNTMAWTKAKFGLAALVIALSLLGPILLQWRARAGLRDRDELLRQQSDLLRSLETTNRQLSAVIGERELAQRQLNDLDRLRAQMPALRREGGEVEKLRADNRQMQAAQETPQSVLQVKEKMIARSGFTYAWTLALVRYAKAHDGAFPESLDLAAPFLAEGSAANSHLSPDLLEVTYHGSVNDLTNPANVILLREKEPWQTTMKPDPSKDWAKYYGYADGSVKLRTQHTNNFDAWEREHGGSVANQ